MAQPSKHKPPLDVLQSMINGILIEIGKALGSNDKETGRTLASGSTRLQTTIPSAADHFHQALDELEIDILRAKAVLQRDLEEKRAERLAKETPVQAPETKPEEAKAASPIIMASPRNALSEHEVNEPPTDGSLVPPTPQQPDTISAPEPAPMPVAPMSIETKPEMQRTDSQQKPNQDSSVPTPDPVGLGISTAQDAPPAQSQDAVPTTVEAATSAIDSLFDIPDATTVNDDTFNFDDMDFSVDATNNPDQTQTQATEFDLSTFGNDTQDFGMLDIPVTTANNTNDLATTKEDDIFGDLGVTTDGNMDLDLGNMDMGEGNTFDDLFSAGGDGDYVNTGGGEMEHGDFDREFFGLE